MNNDPAMLLYTKDWIADTAEMEPAEKGIYIDLLCHQHANSDLPSDNRKLSKIARLPENEFNSLFNNIKHKFLIVGDRMVNHKLNQIIQDRFNFAKKKRLLGHYAVLIRKAEIPQNKLKTIKNQFNIANFMDFEEKEATERLTVWFTERLNHTVDRSEDEDVDANEDVIINNINNPQTVPEKPTWKTSFEEYQKNAQEGYEKLKTDFAWIEERKKYHPGYNILLSLEKSHNDFWSKEAGWKNKKTAKTKNIDWKATYNNSLKFNLVWDNSQKQTYNQPQIPKARVLG